MNAPPPRHGAAWVSLRARLAALSAAERNLIRATLDVWQTTGDMQAASDLLDEATLDSIPKVES